MKDNIKAILIDHDDSFTCNLQHWLLGFVAQVSIINHREIDAQSFAEFDLVVLSPGPKHPQDYPHILNWLKNVSPEKPVFAVCLGMQLMALASGAKVQSYTPPLHGKTSRLVSPTDFNDLQVARYHSLACDFTNSPFDILATSDHLPMWIRHQNKKWMAVQFHPESFMTEKPALFQKHIKEWI